jgi:predicted nucleotidyltransferase
MELPEIERVIRDVLSSRPQPAAAVYLFGSTARGTARPGSDVDVGVLFEQDPPRTLDTAGFDIEADLERRLKRPAQVVILNWAPPDLVHRVLRDGRLVIDANPSRRIAFEVASRGEYFDLERYLRRYRRREAS